VPLFFYTYNPSIAALWFLGLVAGAIIFTWLFNSSRGSILIVALFHGTFNFATASSIGGGMAAAILSMLAMVWAVVVVWVFKPATLAGAEKEQTLAELAPNRL
jgi:hypothetical protein